uniref:hypothetical protein n=1 Tax=Candidatus Cryptobacteroides bacterium TaxID=3085639 RepID=UPI003FF01808
MKNVESCSNTRFSRSFNSNFFFSGLHYTKGTVKTRAGMNFVPKYPGVDGLGTNAGLKYPCGLLPMPDGSMLLADGTGFTIRRIYSK